MGVLGSPRFRIVGAAVLCAVAFAVGVLVGPALRKKLASILSASAVAQGHASKHERPLSVLSGKKTFVLLTLGQSNAANHGETKRRSVESVFAFDKSKLYDAEDPLPGATGDGGSVWTRLGDRIVAAGKCDAVVLIALGVTGSAVSEWAPGGVHNVALRAAIADAERAGLSLSHVLWHQGETDVVRGTSKVDYERAFLSLVADLRSARVTAPIYVAVATHYSLPHSGTSVAAIQDAQRELGLRHSDGLFAGADTDVIGNRDRYDGTHFSNEGLKRAADLWFESMGFTE